MAYRLSTRLLRAAVLGLLGAALAWATPGLASTGTQSSITVTAKCVGTAGKLRIDYTVRSWEPQLTAPEVEVWFQVNSGAREPLPSGSFAPGQEEFSGHFLIDAPAAEGSTLVIFARAHWTDQSEKSINQKSAPVPLPVCGA